MEKEKRERSANFTLQERAKLINLIQKYKNIIENKKSDGSTWKAKENSWKNIEKEFNARSSGVNRSKKTLKLKYEGLKRSLRKKSAIKRSELYRSGGGPNAASPLDPVEEQLKIMITLCTNEQDSDVLPSQQLKQEPENFSILNLNQDENEYIDMTYNKSQNQDIQETEFISLPIVPEVESMQSNPKKSFATPKQKWDGTSRRNLKTRKHPALSSNTRKRTSFEQLTEAKLDLVQLQRQLLKTEIELKQKEAEEKQKERDFAEEEREWKREEYKLKLDILRKELNNKTE